MPESKVERARRKLEQARAELAKAIATADMEQPRGPRSIVEYSVTWGKRAYTYVAVKAQGRWYITGNKTGAYTWEDITSVADPGSIEIIRH